MKLAERCVRIAVATAGILLLAGSAHASMNNGGNTSKSTTASRCLAQYHACYRHCDGWYKGSSAEINSCKTRTCDYQYLHCVPQ